MARTHSLPLLSSLSLVFVDKLSFDRLYFWAHFCTRNDDDVVFDNEWNIFVMTMGAMHRYVNGWTKFGFSGATARASKQESKLTKPIMYCANRVISSPYPMHHSTFDALQLKICRQRRPRYNWVNECDTTRTTRMIIGQSNEQIRMKWHKAMASCIWWRFLCIA